MSKQERQEDDHEEYKERIGEIIEERRELFDALA